MTLEKFVEDTMKKFGIFNVEVKDVVDLVFAEAKKRAKNQRACLDEGEVEKIVAKAQTTLANKKKEKPAKEKTPEKAVVATVETEEEVEDDDFKFDQLELF